MAVLTESFSVVIKKSSLNQLFARGSNSFKEYVSAQQFCHDDKLYSVHFTDVDELEQFIDEMIYKTYDQLTVNDFALIDMIE
jgi:hypothetical protein